MTARDAMLKLNRVFDYLRPRMQGDAAKTIPVNAEAKAGAIVVDAMIRLLRVID